MCPHPLVSVYLCGVWPVAARVTEVLGVRVIRVF